MPLIPDIAAHGMEFMNFFFHVEGGFAGIESFWMSRGVPESEWAGVAYLEVKGLSKPQTASIQWRRSGKDCCDVRLAIDASTPETIGYPEDEQHRITEDVFREFLNFVRTMQVGGIIARYGAAISVSNLGMFSDTPVGRVKRIVLEAGKDKSTVTADFQRTKDGSWRVSLEPKRALRFYDKPVEDDFFTEPLKTGAILVAPLLDKKYEERPQPVPQRD